MIIRVLLSKFIFNRVYDPITLKSCQFPLTVTVKHILIIEHNYSEETIYYCCYNSLSHEILSYYACACRKGDVWTTGNGRNVWLVGYHEVLIST